MAFCPSQCADIVLIPNPVGGCDFKTRKNTLSRLAFMSCGIEIPEPITQAGIEPLFADGSIVVSSPLRNVVWSDPETEDMIISDCLPASKAVVKRTLTFEDVVALAVEVSPGPPAVIDECADYAFWKDKKAQRVLLRYGFVNCAGDFWFARDENGNLMEAWLEVFITYQKLTGAGGSMEIKKGTLDFTGDPLDFRCPDFNLIDFGIDV